ncbi:cyclic nucleotide-binding domain-containing protein [uncultured Hymenobacter sp.]|uniref:cyclic nucleotide-binding domain-containing protein n=1 Tax=uncultured Hymenobacter sp. TaxID=170016 RepID=UPI0035CC5077
MEKWYRFLGVRPGETRTVWLYFAHNFLLGTGTILVYVAANVLLLANHPERSLPLGYCAGALAMMGVGRLYAYCEHHWPLRRLAGRALLAAAVLTLVLGLVLRLGPSVGAAVAVMAGYRLIYLLTNLEFWGMSAVVFNVRQGRRLFSVISAGDLPAKALGAVLAVFVHAQNELYGLLLLAFGFYLLALLIQRNTFRARVIEARPAPPRGPRPLRSPLSQRLLGGSPLVRAMGFSLLALAAVAAGVEYSFFINVKHKLHDQATVLPYVGGVLALTYLLAMVFKLLFSRHGLDRLGVRRTLVALPLAALAGVLGFGGLQVAHAGPAAQMLYFGGLYLALEVLRRALFEPVFLVLFQPLTPAERLEGHTLVKGFYEPLGLGLGGLALLGFAEFDGVNQGLLFAWLGLLLLGALLLLQRTYQKYLDELKGALGLRFTEGPALDGAAAEAPAAPAPTEAIPYPPSPEQTLQTIEHLRRAGPAALAGPAKALLRHADRRVRHRVLSLLGAHTDAGLLRQLVLRDPDPGLRELAAYLAGHHHHAADLLDHPDLAVRQGAIRGRLAAAPTDAPALASLAAVAAAPAAEARLVALTLVGLLPPAQQVELVAAGLRSPEPALVQAAVHAAADLPTPPLLEQLIRLLFVKAVREPAATSLVRLGAAALPPLKAAMTPETDGRRLQALTQVCARLASPAARQLLLEVTQGPNLPARAAALKALGSFATVPADAPVFQRLVEEELRLAQHLLHGMVSANTELRTALRYELRRGQQRLFGLLMQVYERQPMRDAQRGAAHTAGERQANALEMLDNLIPRPLYQGLQAMLDVGRLSDKVLTFDSLLGPALSAEPIQTTIVRRGLAAFSAWTIGVALRQWHPQPATVAYLYPHLLTDDALIRESAEALLRQLPLLRPAAHDHFQILHPAISPPAMTTTSAPTPCRSAQQRVLLLKGTTLFAETPENVLGTIVPIMKEVVFEPEQEIFAKGSLGTSLFVVCEGEVGIYDGPRQLTTFRQGDFFGELALLDAEARSATAVALGPVVAFRIDQEDFYDVLEECAEVVRSIMRVLCQRLRRQNEKMPPVAA